MTTASPIGGRSSQVEERSKCAETVAEDTNEMIRSVCENTHRLIFFGSGGREAFAGGPERGRIGSRVKQKEKKR